MASRKYVARRTHGRNVLHRTTNGRVSKSKPSVSARLGKAALKPIAKRLRLSRGNLRAIAGTESNGSESGRNFPSDIRKRTIKVNMKGTSPSVLKKNLVPKGMKALWTYQQQYFGTDKTPAGAQGGYTMFGVNTAAQIVTSSGAGYTPQQNYTALQQLNPNLKNTGSTLITAGSIPATDRFLIKSIEIDLDITNLATLAQEVQFYVVACKKSTSQDPVTLWASGMTNAANGLGILTLPAAATGVAGYPTFSTPGCRYSDQTLAQQYWSTKHRCEFELQPGSSEKIRIEIPWNKIINVQMIQQSTTSYISGYTLHFFFVNKGQVIYDTTLACAIHGQAEFAWTALVRYKMGPVMANAGRQESVYASTSEPTETVTTNQKIADVFTGVVEGIANVL